MMGVYYVVATVVKWSSYNFMLAMQHIVQLHSRMVVTALQFKPVEGFATIFILGQNRTGQSKPDIKYLLGGIVVWII